MNNSEWKKTKVICGNCENIFYEDELELFYDKGEWFKGCPNCKTDEYLKDITDDDIKNYYSNLTINGGN